MSFFSVLVQVHAQYRDGPYAGFDTQEEYEADKRKRAIERAEATVFFNNVILVISAIVCPIMLILSCCNCWLKYKRKRFMEKVKKMEAEIEERQKEAQ